MAIYIGAMHWMQHHHVEAKDSFISALHELKLPQSVADEIQGIWLECIHEYESGETVL